MGLSDYLREKRKEKDWSQRDLANASGISNAEISRIESGKRKTPSTDVLKAIAKALNTPVDEIFQQAGVIEEGKAIVDRILAEHEDEPISSIAPQAASFSTPASYITVDDLSEEEIEDVKKYINFLKSKRS